VDHAEVQAPVTTPALLDLTTTQLPGWFAEIYYDTEDGTCAGHVKNPSMVKELWPLDVCAKGHGGYMLYTCKDGALTKQDYWLREEDDTGNMGELCHLGSEKELFKLENGAFVRDFDANCETEGIRRGYRCGGTEDDEDVAVADPALTPNETRDNILTHAQCVQACKNRRETEGIMWQDGCTKMAFHEASQTCELWTTDGGTTHHCNSSFKADGWDILEERGPVDNGSLNTCDDTGDALPGGYIAYSRRGHYNGAERDPTCEDEQSKEYFVFDICARKHHSNDYHAVYCVDDKVWLGQWTFTEAELADLTGNPCTGTPDTAWRVTAGCTEVNEGSSEEPRMMKVKATWWGACNAPPSPPPTERPTYPPVPLPTPNTDTLYQDLVYVGRESQIPGYLTENMKGGSYPLCNGEEDDGKTIFHKENHCVLWEKGGDSNEAPLFVKIFCINGESHYVTASTVESCQGMTEKHESIEKIDQPTCDWHAECDTSGDAVAGFDLQIWEDSNCETDLMMQTQTFPLGYCIAGEFYDEEARGAWWDGDSVVYGRWKAGKCKNAPDEKVTLKQDVCTSYLYDGEHQVYLKWAGNMHEGASGNGVGPSSNAAGIFSGIAAFLGGLTLLLR